MAAQEITKRFIEEFRQPATLEETKIKNLLGQSSNCMELNEYQQEHPECREEILLEIAGKLADMDFYKGCCSAFLCGILMRETEPGEAGVKIVDFFTKALRHACRVLDASGDEYPEEAQLDSLFLSDPDAVKAFRGLPPLTLAVMDTLAKSADSREYLRCREVYNEIERVSSFLENGRFLLQIYPVCGELEVVVLAPQRKQGLVAKVRDVGTNFHLMTLLERALWQSGQVQAFGLSPDIGLPANQKLFAYASGEEQAKQNLSVTAHGSYSSYDGVMLWGEMPPDSIPRLHGMPVVLIAPEQISRSWDLYFAVRCHPYLRPDVEISRILSPGEVEEWIGRLPGKPNEMKSNT